MGGLLIGLSTFQGEFDFGVPQFRMVFQPMLIALAAGIALDAARIWIGKGGALATALMFFVVRGAIDLIVGDVFGESSPALPLYLVEALCVEGVALAVGRDRPIALGALGGLLCGTVGFAVRVGLGQGGVPAAVERRDHARGDLLRRAGGHRGRRARRPARRGPALQAALPEHRAPRSPSAPSR